MAEFQQEWREFHIHNDSEDNNNQEEEDVIYASGINLFGNMQEEEEEETMNFSFSVVDVTCFEVNGDEWTSTTTGKKKSVEVTLKGFSDYTQSTGLAVWLGSEILATFMAQHPYLIRDKTVLELGSGLGLAGIASHHLDSKKSVLTDGDSLVLNDYLSFNVKQNDRQRQQQQQAIHDAGGPDTTVDGSTASSQIGTIECHQLIWGHRGRSSADVNGEDNDQSPLVQFRKKHGHFDVILAADCTYIPQSVEPFWETIDFLLKRDHTGDDASSAPKVIYVMEASTQAKFEDILDSAKRRGFEWTIDTMPLLLDETPDYKGKHHKIYTFWRSS